MFKTIVSYSQKAKASVLGFWQDTASEVEEDRSWLKFIVYGLIALALIIGLLGISWSSEPELFSVKERIGSYRAAKSGDESSSAMITGVATTATLIEAASVLLEKRGGYISNDVLPPGLFMDNIPNWEYGALTQIRDLTRALREAYSRSQSQSTEDASLKDAEAQFNFDNTSWILPQTEDEYRAAIKALRNYLGRLTDESKQNAQFYARADNLHYWLVTVETRLGSLSQNLSASVGQRRLNTDLAGDSAATQSTNSDFELEIKTPWMQIDDVFYRARGSTWALILFLKAAEVDFADVLEKKNARVSLQQIIRELEATQEPIFSPLILNGSGFGMLANHSLVMASYISRANAGIIDLRELLTKG